MAGRTTQVPWEFVTQNTANARVTQEPWEFVTGNTANARVTQVAWEFVTNIPPTATPRSFAVMVG